MGIFTGCLLVPTASLELVLQRPSVAPPDGLVPGNVVPVKSDCDLKYLMVQTIFVCLAVQETYDARQISLY